MKIDYAIIVKNKTRLETLIERFNTKSQAQFYIESSGGNFEDYEIEHEIFHAALLSLQSQLSKVLKNKIVERKYVPSFLFAKNHVIIVIGQDGLVANTAKYANACPIIAVNPDKSRYDGVLLPFDKHNFMDGVENVLVQKYPFTQRRFAEARMKDGQRLLAFNDLFIGANSHISARYKINFQDITEEHSSSGIIVSTAAGSTGWLSSIFNMAYGVAGLFETDLTDQRPTIHDDQLIFAVREPFKSIRSQTDVTVGIINKDSRLTIESFMPTNGIIFSDGIEADHLKFNSGSIASIGLAKENAILVTT